MADRVLDACPVHDLAVRDPGATVQIYDETGRYLYPMSAERACDSHHLGAALDRYIRPRLKQAIDQLITDAAHDNLHP
jgi:hypothetical protein